MTFSSSRRRFLRTTMQAAGAGIAVSALPLGLRRAWAMPARAGTGTIDDVQHIVVFMQENRGFDHYFGTLRGVRGFGDPRPARLPNGKPVWHQPVGEGAGEVLPFRPPAPRLGMQFLEDVPHNWSGTHDAWHDGRCDRWVEVKGATSMAYLTRADIPYHYRLADLFTICDAYHCSLLGGTHPNRNYLWTGWVGNDGKGGGPCVDNVRFGGDQPGFSWSTFPELLERAGISWKTYQDVGKGLDVKGAWGLPPDPFIGNMGNNALLSFRQFRDADPDSGLYRRSRSGTDYLKGDSYLDDLRHDVENNTLPQVSWIVGPEAFSEHPSWPAGYGAWYTDQVLQALTSNPEVWASTVLLLTYDENDGFFDHVSPPFAPAHARMGRSTVSTENEYFAGHGDDIAGPYGLGMRVPMIVVSPWSRGGWVCSEVFDHTSVIRFIEARFGRKHDIREPNITPWRRAVCGDLTSAFNFADPEAAVPRLPDASACAPPDHKRRPDYRPLPPLAQEVPTQEPGVRPARPLPYRLDVQLGEGDADDGMELRFINSGRAGAHFLLYRNGSDAAVRSYTVEAGKRLVDRLAVDAEGRFDVAVHGPNGFLRCFAGTVRSGQSMPTVTATYDHARGNAQLQLRNPGGSAPRTFTIADAYRPGREPKRKVPGGQMVKVDLDLGDTFGWYDVTVAVSGGAPCRYRLAGHVETGRSSMSDPALGGGV